MFRMIHSALYWLGLVSAQEEASGWRPFQVERARPGTRVRDPEGYEGTLSGLYLQDGLYVARVIFSGGRRSWVSLVAVEQLEMS